ncbi:MAG: tRNA dihydrouridine synthase [Desulfonatronovibrionaceae bacterium]
MPCLLPISPASPWLGPMAGFSDLPFRMLCRGYGCSVACTEMISAKGLMHQSKGTVQLLQTCPGDSPLVVQLFGSDPDFIAPAAGGLLERGFSFFDLNCGCAVKKVTKTGAGAALLKEPQLLFQTAKTLLRAVGEKKAGFKLRLGWDACGQGYIAIAQALEQMGAGWITLHPRYAVQKFSGTADWTAVAELKRKLNIPVIASGDLFTAQHGIKCLELTGADAVMFARGALQDPAIFARFKRMYGETTTSCPPPPGTMEVFQALVAEYKKRDPGKKGLLKLRTLGPKIIREIPGAGALRQKICRCQSWEEAEELAAEVKKAQKANPTSCTGDQK